MYNMLRILKEQYSNRRLILRLALHEQRSKYQLHYLGMLWQVFNPLMQVMVFWVIFGLGIRGGKDVGDIPFFVWLVIGLIPWFYINPTVLQGANSVHQKIRMVSKMKFPISVLPSIVIVGNGMSYLLMLGILGIILIVNQINPGLYILQLPYNFMTLFIFLYVFTLFSSTIATVIRDYYQLLQAGMRMVFFLTPILWVPNTMPDWLSPFLQLNPFYYIIEGFRDTFLGRAWFFENLAYMSYFWSGVLVLAFIGSYIHYKFKDSFVDYL
ncbi:ABC transporter permease [Alkalicoccobacillus gibsonii]|jgi:teichoic acid transport system permease protein|uniref:Transport permease protein n=1 Tax=Alkalicoccobacillus gibsonii TaxID=79881 RepID=A0ABU9VLJ9_9BACI